MPSMLMSFKVNTSKLKVCFKNTLEFQDKYVSLERLFKIKTSILKVCFKYTSEFEKKYNNLEYLLPVYF